MAFAVDELIVPVKVGANQVLIAFRLPVALAVIEICANPTFTNSRPIKSKAIGNITDWGTHLFINFIFKLGLVDYYGIMINIIRLFIHNRSKHITYT